VTLLERPLREESKRRLNKLLNENQLFDVSNLLAYRIDRTD
jgi:hypothetical protein